MFSCKKKPLQDPLLYLTSFLFNLLPAVLRPFPDQEQLILSCGTVNFWKSDYWSENVVCRELGWSWETTLSFGTLASDESETAQKQTVIQLRRQGGQTQWVWCHMKSVLLWLKLNFSASWIGMKIMKIINFFRQPCYTWKLTFPSELIKKAILSGSIGLQHHSTKAKHLRTSHSFEGQNSCYPKLFFALTETFFVRENRLTGKKVLYASYYKKQTWIISIHISYKWQIIFIT